MKDSTTKSPLRVSTDGTSGPYVMVPVSQVDELQTLLRSKSVPFWTDDVAISVDGEPEIAVVNLGQSANVEAVQHILDSVP